MESLSSTVTAAMAVPGNSASMVAPSCRILYPMSSRFMFVTGSSLQVHSARPLSCISRSLNVVHATLVSSPEETDEAEDGTVFKKDENGRSVPNTFEVQSLLMEVCDETSIAELELKVGAFELHVKRDVGKLKGPAAAVVVAPQVPSMPMAESAVPAPVVSSSAPKAPSVALLASLASKSGSKVGLLEAGSDEGLRFVTAPKVGLFRRSRVVKGKSGRPLCEEGQIVKQGQVVCYVEQLGTQQPVEAENSGEVVKILCEDGEPVGYSDPLVAIRPSFPGIL